jgi:hypothetical protein
LTVRLFGQDVSIATARIDGGWNGKKASDSSICERTARVLQTMLIAQELLSYTQHPVLAMVPVLLERRAPLSRFNGCRTRFLKWYPERAACLHHES